MNTSKLIIKVSIPGDLESVGVAHALFLRLMSIHAWLGKLEESRTVNLSLAFLEMIENAAEWGSLNDPSKEIIITLKISNEELEISIQDQGSGFDIEAVPDPTLPENIMKDGGRGIFYARQAYDSVWYEDGGRRAILIRKNDTTT